MEIEVGKYYKTRCGYKVQIYAIHAEKYGYRNIHGAFFNSGFWVPQAWDPKGNFLTNEEYGLDIVSEWTEPHPAESWEVDKKILVSDDGQIWAKRHFSKFENGAVYTWPSGLTSWSNTSVFPSFEDDMAWKFAKPAEEEE